jgi:hypothetical protein
MMTAYEIRPINWGNPADIRFCIDLSVAHKERLIWDGIPSIEVFLKLIKQENNGFIVLRDGVYIGCFWLDYEYADVAKLHFAFVGTGIRSLKGVVAYCFEALRLRKIEVYLLLEELKTGKKMHLVEKILKKQLGFRKQGKKTAHLLKNGSPIDLLDLALVRS